MPIDVVFIVMVGVVVGAYVDVRVDGVGVFGMCDGVVGSDDVVGVFDDGVGGIEVAAVVGVVVLRGDGGIDDVVVVGVAGVGGDGVVGVVVAVMICDGGHVCGVSVGIVVDGVNVAVAVGVGGWCWCW